jgi:hypothetical protein
MGTIKSTAAAAIAAARVRRKVKVKIARIKMALLVLENRSQFTERSGPSQSQRHPRTPALQNAK